MYLHECCKARNQNTINTDIVDAPHKKALSNASNGTRAEINHKPLRYMHQD